MKSIQSIKYISIITIISLMASCGSGGGDGGDPPPPTDTNKAPVATSYIFPVNNQVCTGTIQPNSIDVDFEWDDFTDENIAALSYTLTVVEQSSSTTVINESVANTTQKTVSLEKGKTYSWKISATDDEGETTEGATWQFQTPFDIITNYAPFPATLHAPFIGEKLQGSNVTLIWEGNDPDLEENTQLSYDVYLSTESSPELFQSGISTTSVDVSLESGTYYWKIKTTDPNGNSSYSQTWQFTVN